MTRRRVTIRASPSKLLLKRVNSIYSAQKRRAKKYHKTLNYSAGELFEMVWPLPNCYLCHQPVTVKDLTFAHKDAVSRGGSFFKSNLAVTHSGCNRLQGVLSCESYNMLMGFLDTLPIEDAKDIRMRLKSGAAFQFSKWGH